ncbi:hypothetical protein SCG7109_AE_00020 [Chlamydiales bacterium SCGC AG-110-M15]|nr:hypothetical protein SCG7109_AE_00020 [Chlamydiales bacterium SCGC AG-110-M15]
MWVTDYEGGDNPLLVYILLAIVVLLIGLAVFYAFWGVYRKSKFLQVCNLLHIDGDEVGMLKNFIKKFRVADELDLLLKRHLYDSFIADCATHFGNLGISDEELQHDINQFSTIRHKLRFQHSYNKRNIYSSRALPAGHSVSIKHYDPNTHNTLSYRGTVVENNEFFLGVSLPSEEILEDLTSQKKPGLEVTFFREHDAEYFFDTVLFRYNKVPTPCLFLEHSKTLNHGIQQRPLDIDAKVMCQSNEGVGEYDVVVELIDQNGCSFYLEDDSIVLNEDTSVLLHCNLDGNDLSFQATIDHASSKNGRHVYSMPFTDLTDEVKKQLIKFSLQYFGKSKKKSLA